jgi:hypothetical protein
MASGLTNNGRPVLRSILFHAFEAASGAQHCRANLPAAGGVASLEPEPGR